MKLQQLSTRLAYATLQPSPTHACSSISNNASATDVIETSSLSENILARTILAPSQTALVSTSRLYDNTQASSTGIGLSPAATAGAIVGVLGTAAVIGLIWRYCNPVGRASRKPLLETPVELELLHPPPYVQNPPPAYRR